MINIQLLKPLHREIGAFDCLITNLLLTNKGFYLFGRERSEGFGNLIHLSQIHFSEYQPFVYQKEADQWNVIHQYDDNPNHWKLVDESKKLDGNKVIISTTYVRDIVSSTLVIDDNRLIIENDHLGADWKQFNDKDQESGFITYLDNWLSFNPIIGDYGDYFKATKGFDKYLSSVHLNNGLKLRSSGTMTRKLRGEEAGTLDDEDVVKHFVMILSSI